MEKEYFIIDVESGDILDVVLLAEGDDVPDDHKQGWGTSRSFHKPVWCFETNDWKEGLTADEILAPMKQAKIEELSAQCQNVIMTGFEHNGDFFQFNDKDQANFNQQLSLMLLDDTIASVLWKTENNGVKNFPRQDFIEVCKAGERHKRNSIGRYWQLKEYVTSHTFGSKEELNAVHFNMVLPS